MQAGTLFFIVGASGVGKDTLIAEAMRLLQGTHRYMQVRRVITRPAGNGEDHKPVSEKSLSVLGGLRSGIEP